MYIRKVLGSMGFLGTFIIVLRAMACLNTYRGKLDFLFILALSVSCTSGVLFEDPSRGEEYSIFTFSKILEGFWDLLKKLGLAKDIPYAINILFSCAIGVLLYLKKFHANDMPLNYKNQLTNLFGEEDNIISI